MLHTAQQLDSHRRFLPHWAQTRHQAPLSQMVKEEMISGALNLFDQRKWNDWLLRLHVQLRFRNVLGHFLTRALLAAQFIQNQSDTRHSESPRLESLLLKQAPLISTQDATGDVVGFPPHTDYGMEVHMPFQVLLKSSTKIKLFSLLPLITVFISVSF